MVAVVTLLFVCITRHNDLRFNLWRNEMGAGVDVGKCIGVLGKVGVSLTRISAPDMRLMPLLPEPPRKTFAPATESCAVGRSMSTQPARKFTG